MEKRFSKSENNLKDLFKKWGKPPKELMKRYNKTSVANFYIWSSGQQCPPLKLLLDMTWETETNIEYALGLTDAKAKNDTNVINFRLSELLEEQNCSYRALSIKLGTSYATIKRYAERDIMMRVETLLALADGLHVSLDYLLGLTSHRTWDEYKKMIDPFSGIAPGDALYLSFPDKELNGNVLVHPQGGKVVFPTGKMRSIRDDLFNGVKVERLEPSEK